MATRPTHPVVNDQLTRDLDDVLAELDADGKRRVLEFSTELARKRQATGLGGALLAFAGAIPPDDLALMEEAIADGCETVDPTSW